MTKIRAIVLTECQDTPRANKTKRSKMKRGKRKKLQVSRKFIFSKRVDLSILTLYTNVRYDL
jgi:hypothetical protein